MYHLLNGLIALVKGETGSVENSLKEIDGLLTGTTPDVKVYIHYYYGLLQAEIYLSQKRFDEAIHTIQNLSEPPLPRIMDPHSYFEHNLPLPRDGLARAYYGKGDVGRAIVEYERLTRFDPDSPGKFMIRPIYHYRLARLYEAKGMREEAVERYRKLLLIWKDADEGMDELTDARARLTALAGNE
jgi:tetratricopeptide (TPR) repeat protein